MADGAGGLRGGGEHILEAVLHRDPVRCYAPQTNNIIHLDATTINYKDYRQVRRLLRLLEGNDVLAAVFYLRGDLGPAATLHGNRHSHCKQCGNASGYF